MLHTIVTVTLLTAVCADNCSTWLHSSGDGHCLCGSSLGILVVCNNETQQVGVIQPYCLTSNGDESNVSVVGACLAALSNYGEKLWSPIVPYWEVSPSISEQDKQTCGYLNRQGQLCAKCKLNHSVSAYSYDLKCYHCTSSLWSNVMLYICVAYLPLTLFLFVILVFHISVTSPAMNAFVLLCQVLSAPFVMRNLLVAVMSSKDETVYVKLLGTFYSIWNLDFFRTLYPPICLPLNTLQLIALDYLVAAYPLLLLSFFYVLLMAYNRGYVPFVRLLKPCLWCAARLRQEWFIKNSIIDSFATFIVLSYIKFLNTSFDLLLPTYIYNEYGSLVGTFLYINATIEFMGTTHIPYAVLAITVLLIGIFLPLLLILLYPMLWFQQCLNRCGLNKPVLQMLMQSFQGYYRDRTDGGWECRYFAAVYPAFKIAFYIIYSVTLTTSSFVFAAVPLCITVTVLIFILQPYKPAYKAYNKVDFLLFVSLALFFSANAGLEDAKWKLIRNLNFIFASLLGLLPFVYFTINCGWLLRRFLREKLHFLKFCIPCHKLRADQRNDDETPLL